MDAVSCVEAPARSVRALVMLVSTLRLTPRSASRDVTSLDGPVGNRPVHNNFDVTSLDGPVGNRPVHNNFDVTSLDGPVGNRPVHYNCM